MKLCITFDLLQPCQVWTQQGCWPHLDLIPGKLNAKVNYVFMNGSLVDRKSPQVHAFPIVFGYYCWRGWCPVPTPPSDGSSGDAPTPHKSAKGIAHVRMHAPPTMGAVELEHNVNDLHFAKCISLYLWHFFLDCSHFEMWFFLKQKCEWNFFLGEFTILIYFLLQNPNLGYSPLYFSIYATLLYSPIFLWSKMRNAASHKIIQFNS